MLTNYFKVAIRNFWKNKTVTVINVLGLAIGISAALVIYLIIQYDYNFDKWEPGRDRIYRVVTDAKTWKNPGVATPVPNTIKEEVPGVQTVAHFFNTNEISVSIPHNGSKPRTDFKKQMDGIYADSEYFKIFPHEWLAGNEHSSLSQPYSIVLSEGRCKLYFPDLTPQQIIGKSIVVSDTMLVSVSGVVKEVINNSDFKSACFISMATVIADKSLSKYYSIGQWNNFNGISQCFIKLGAGVQPQKVEQQINKIVSQHIKDDDGFKATNLLQPLSDVHFNQDFGGPANKKTLRNLSLLALFLLLLGAINFINLSTAQSLNRSKEIGIRKTLGSNKKSLVFQFLSETLVITVIATFLSVLLVPLLFQAFSGFIPSGLKMDAIAAPHIIIFLGVEILSVTLLAGFYPALSIARFRPVSSLKNEIIKTSGNNSAWIRKTLIVTQFIIAQVFIIGVLVVSKQIHFALTKNMGFRKEAIITANLPRFMNREDPGKKVLVNEVRNIPGVEAASLGNREPAMNGFMTQTIRFNDGKKEINSSIDSRNGDTAYLSVYQIPLVAGRNVQVRDSMGELLINETMVKFLGFKTPQEAIGKIIDKDGPIPIVGVMKDFNIASIRKPVQPLMFWGDAKHGYVLHVALPGNHPENWKKIIQQIEVSWRQVYPGKEFDYSFLDQSIEKFYNSDIKLSKLLKWATALSVFISCIGLLGLSIFMVNQRTKEIGIRKVMGARVWQLVLLLLKSLLVLVLLAALIAVPIALIFMQKWLNDFAYKTDLSWWLFGVSIAGMFLIAMLVLSFQTIKAAIANPVKSLRTE